MRAPSHRTFLVLLSLGLLFPIPGRTETPAEVQQRLEQYRQLDAEAAQRRAKQEAEQEQRREQTRQWQEQRQREEYARRWKRYGDEEIDVLKWRQQTDGTWVTEFKGLNPTRNASTTKGSTARELNEIPTIEAPDSRPGPPQLEPPPVPPQRFDESLDELVRQGVVKPEELSLIRGGGAPAPLDVGAFRQACRSGALSSQDCRGGLAIRWGRRANWASRPAPLPSPAALLGVNCTSLMVNRKPPYKSWGQWMRPAAGSAAQQLVIDRCATAKA